MNKINTELLTADEMQVLSMLERNAKENINEIVEKCGFSRQKIWKIIKGLQDKKIIWGYTAVTDEKAKNLKHFTALVKRTHETFDNEILKEVLFNDLDRFPAGLVKTENIYYTNGICDFIFTFYATDTASAKKFLEMQLVRLQKYVKEYTLIETLFPIHKQGIKNPHIKKITEFI